MAYTQDNRLISIDTPLGKDVLLLQGFTGQESISRLFNFQLDLLSERSVDPSKILGKRATITLRLADGSARHFNGFVSRFTLLGSERRFTHYQAEVVPWLWFLTRTSDCRIFQNQTIPDIVTTVFRDLGFTDFRNLVQGVDEPREYCAQYRETDFNFVSRLMEQYGIFYFFEHGAEQHTLVMANSPSAHQACPKQASARFEAVAQTLEAEDVITGWQVERQFQAGKYALRDYNFETPHTRLEATVESALTLGGIKKYEIHDYPGGFLKKPHGDRLAKTRIEEEETPHTVITGTSTCRSFATGYTFDLDGPSPAQNGAYVITQLQHMASVGETYATGGESEAESYSNHFTCIPAGVPFRPARISPRPTVQGCQTGIVAGKQGEEIWTDKYGRVKVQFHWDRRGKYDEHSSCWIRVAQSWAGKRWGATFIPRTGQEVVIDFLEGDPDRPIVIGSVYNAEQMPPYALPGEQTKSTIKSYSSKGGGGFNEIRIEDKKDGEQLFIHAERNQDVRVAADSLECVGAKRHLIVTRDQLEQVKGDKHRHVNGDQNEKIDGTLSFEAGMDQQKKAGMKYALDAGMEIHLKSGLNLVLETGTSLTAKVGGNFININPGGIFLQGTLVMLNSGGSPGTGSGASVQPPKDPKEADADQPGETAQLPTQTPGRASPQAMALQQAARTGAPFCERCAEAAYAAAIAAGASPEEAEAAAQRAGREGAAAEADAPSDAELRQQATGPVEPGAGPAPAAAGPTPRAAEPAREEEEEEDGAAEAAPEAEEEPETPLVDVIIRLDVDPSDASSLDDRFVLESTDGSYRSEKTVKDDHTPGDEYTDLLYTGLSRDKSYTLKAFTSEGAAPTIVFENVPYDQLAGLSSRSAEQQD